MASKYIGVKWNRDLQKWSSSFSENGIRYHCGFYDCEKSAVKARDIKIVEIGSKKKLQILKTIGKND